MEKYSEADSSVSLTFEYTWKSMKIERYVIDHVSSPSDLWIKKDLILVPI